MNASWALQKALYALLTGAVSVQALVLGRVYDFVPEDTPRPYIVLGDDQETDWPDAPEGSEVFATVNVYSDGPGWEEAKTVAEAARRALVEPDLETPGYAVNLFHFRDATAIREEGGTMHVALTFRALVHPLEA